MKVSRSTGARPLKRYRTDRRTLWFCQCRSRTHVLRQPSPPGDITIYLGVQGSLWQRCIPECRQIARHGSVFEMAIADMGYGDGVTIVHRKTTCIRGPATVGADIVNVNMDFDTAKALTAAFIANIESIYHAKAPFMAGTWHGETDIALTDMCGNNPVEISPGCSGRLGRSRIHYSRLRKVVSSRISAGHVRLPG